MIKRSLLISCFIFVLFALLDFVFNFISELENLSANYSFLHSLKFMLASMPFNANDFLEGACLLGVMIALGISHQEGNLNVLRSSGESPIKIVLLNAIGPMILVFFLLSSK
jgi:lipopolysaccharide export LptBFGC system permease protein LptF